MWTTQTMKTLQLYREHVTLMTLSTPALITHQPVYTGPFTVSQEIWPTTTLGFIWNRYSKWLKKWWWVIYALLNDIIISKIVHNHYNVLSTTLGLAAFNATFTNELHVSFILFSPSVSSISSKLNFYVIFSSCWSTKAFIFSRMNLFWLKKYTNGNF